MTLCGFSDMTPHEAKLYTVNRALVMSEPATVTFTPLEAPFIKVHKTLQIDPTFGGAQFSWENPDTEKLMFEFFAQDSVGKLRPVRIMSSSAKTTKISLRGYKPVKRIFAAVVRDKWDNASDTVYPSPKYITPFSETQFAKRDMHVMKLTNDASWDVWNTSEQNLFDDSYDTAAHTDYNALPSGLTIDLGKNVKLSRFKYFPMPWNEEYYRHATPRFFEVWTCYGTPSSSGNWDEWTKIMDCEVIKPSGTPDRPDFQSDEDFNYARSGFEFEVDIEVPAVRYIRFLMIRNFEATTFVACNELEFYGTLTE
jgi:hypothetical protein